MMSKNNPLISVIIPVYKVEKYINRCIDSVINQTYTNLEIILVDDGSPDNCGKICDEYAQKDSRVVVIHKENGGLSDARNYGIDVARGEYIMFVDSDDWVHPEIVERLYSGLILNNSQISMADYLETDEIQVDISPISSCDYEVYNPKRFFEEIFWGKNAMGETAWAKLYKRELFENIRYPVGKIHEDTYTTPFLVSKAEKITVTREKMYYYYQRDDSIVHDTSKIHCFDRYESLACVMELFLKTKYDGVYEKYLMMFMEGLNKGYRYYISNSPENA
jgi:glycosyltransferase involved in cell wall biosynthesis